MLVANADGGQTESDRRDAAIGVRPGTVTDQAGRRVGFEPEIVECFALQEFKELRIAGELLRDGSLRLCGDRRQRDQEN